MQVSLALHFGLCTDKRAALGAFRETFMIGLNLEQRVTRLQDFLQNHPGPATDIPGYEQFRSNKSAITLLLNPKCEVRRLGSAVAHTEFNQEYLQSGLSVVPNEQMALTDIFNSLSLLAE
jgi:hypothetical protein